MGATLASAVIGVPLSASFTAFAVAFVRLRSEMHTSFDRLDARFNRLEALISDPGMTLARSAPWGSQTSITDSP